MGDEIREISFVFDYDEVPLHTPGTGAQAADPMETDETVASIDVRAAAGRLEGVVRRTALEPFSAGDPRFELRLKLECRQETNSFKARGAWNQVSQLTPEERERGVVATSSGNHGRAVAWAARRAGVPATIFMAKDVYPNKLAACRAEEAEVVLADTRAEAEELCAARVEEGAVLIHPYDSPGRPRVRGPWGWRSRRSGPRWSSCSSRWEGAA